MHEARKVVILTPPTSRTCRASRSASPTTQEGCPGGPMYPVPPVIKTECFMGSGTSALARASRILGEFFQSNLPGACESYIEGKLSASPSTQQEREES